MANNEKKQKKKVNVARSIGKAVVLLAVCGLLVLFSVSIVNEVLITLDLKNQISVKEGELAELNEQKAQLEQQKANFEDPTYVEQYARGKYKLTKEGEKVYKLPGKTTSEPSGDE